jgi:hypothetical protein
MRHAPEYGFEAAHWERGRLARTGPGLEGVRAGRPRSQDYLRLT